jgi:hypothetical protein
MIKPVEPVDDWEPSASDIEWAEQMIRVMKDGALWGLPTGNLVYCIDHKKKTLTLVEGDSELCVHGRNKKCFGVAGYEVLP